MSSTAESTQPASRRTVADAVAYWLVTGGIYVTFGFLWYYSFKEKLFDQNGHMPPPLKKAFSGSFIDSVPGLDAAWVILGILEGLVFVAVVASLVRLEFVPGRSKSILLGALGLSMLTFGLMLFAQVQISQFDSVASLFGYFTGTAIVIVLVLLMPPYRPARWLSGLQER
jgi:hypothetical protein